MVLLYENLTAIMAKLSRDANPEKEKGHEGEILFESQESFEKPEENIKEDVRKATGEVIYSNEEAMKKLDENQQRLIEEISGKEPWEITKAWDASKAHRETAKMILDRLRQQREQQNIAYENAHAAEKAKANELRIKQAEQKAEEAKIKARKWFRWISGPLTAIGEGIADILKGIGEGAGKALAGIYYGIKERKKEHERKMQDIKLK